MKVKSIAECSPWVILQYFWPALSDNLSWKHFSVFLRVAVLHRIFFSYFSHLRVLGEMKKIIKKQAGKDTEIWHVASMTIILSR